MSIAGNSINTPFNPNKIKPSAEEIKEAVETALAEVKESGEFDGEDGLNPEIYTHKIYKIYSLADIERLCALRSVPDFYIINCGEPFSYNNQTTGGITINTGDIYRVLSINGYLNTLVYLDNNDIGSEEGTLIEWYMPDPENEKAYTSRYTAVLHGKDGNTALGSDKYELIREISVTADTNNNKSFFDIEVNSDQNVFELKAITLFCTLPAMTKTAIDVLLKTKNNVLEYKSAHRRSSISNTDKQYYYRVSLQNEGYWTGSSVVVDGIGGTNPEQGSFARNTVQGDAVGIRIATGDSSIVFPEGTVIEVWGVKA